MMSEVKLSRVGLVSKVSVSSEIITSSLFCDEVITWLKMMYKPVSEKPYIPTQSLVIGSEFSAAS